MMRIGALAFVLLTPGFSQSVDDLIARNIAARGGIERLRAVSTRRIHARITMDGQAGSLQIEQKRPNLFRSEIAFGREKYIRAYDGSSAWEADAEGNISTLSSDERGNMARESDFDGPLIDHASKGITAGITAAHSGPAKIKLRWKDGNVFYYYLDPKTYLEALTDTSHDSGGRELRIQSTFRDYRPVNGLQFAFHIDVSEDGAARQSIQIEKIELNPSIPDIRFTRPEKHSDDSIARK